MLMLYMPRFHVGTLNIFLLLCYAMPSYVHKLKNFAIDHQKINKIETRPKVYIYLRRGSDVGMYKLIAHKQDILWKHVH